MKKLRKSELCLNCSKEISDYNYCPECGQLNTNKHVKIKYFVEDFLGDYITFDSKFFRSFVPLVTKPGFLTNEYNDGRRVNYILPLRLYIFVVFVFFLMFSARVSFSDMNIISSSSGAPEIRDVIEDYTPDKKLDEKRLEELKEKYKVIRRIDKKTVNFAQGFGNGAIAQFFEKKIIKLAEKSQLEGGGDFVSEMFNQIPKTLFLLLPFFALILKLVYIRRKILYVKHLVFALHIHTIVFLIFLLAVIFQVWYVVLFCCIVVVAYVFMAFRKVYKQSVLKTLVKMFMVYSFYFFFFPFAMIFVVFMSLANV